jgi:hypothetical protein
VKVRAASLNASEISLRSGATGSKCAHSRQRSGTIVATGTGVKNVKAADPVTL